MYHITICLLHSELLGFVLQSEALDSQIVPPKVPPNNFMYVI